MKFTLKDYQDEAVRDVLVNLVRARKHWREDGDKQAFSLTAATGAGKTVMAAAVFEALFHGDDNYEFDADPGAVVIWFSDDPSLNEQTRFRLMESSDRLRHTDLVVLEKNPLDDIRNTETIAAVYIAGNSVPTIWQTCRDRPAKACTGGSSTVSPVMPY